MDTVGNYLKKARERYCLSLKDVHVRCGITDSRLSRMERGEGKPPAPFELKKLARLYGIDIVALYIMAGYLEKSDLSDYQLVFKNTDLLSDDEKRNIQTQINLFTKGKRAQHNEF